MDSYGEEEMLESKGEKLLALHIYLLRKIGIVYGKFQLWKARQVAQLFGMKYDLRIEDKEAWNWFQQFRFPWRVERKE